MNLNLTKKQIFAFLPLLVAIFLSATTLSVNAQTVSNIVVSGNKRVEVETVKSYLTFSQGETYSSQKANASLKALFQTGLFSDVGISRSGNTVYVKVEENSVIGKVAFEGNKKIKDAQLTQLVRSKERGVLTQSRVQSDIRLILESYRRIGRFDAEVQAKTIDRSDNRVDLVFEIIENKKTRIRGINFVGNERFSDGRLREVMSTSEGSPLNLFGSSDVYDPDKVQADVELLRQFYLNAGYADFEVISTTADLDRDNNAFFITIVLDEGERYTFGEITVDTILDLDVNDIQKSLKVREGKIYNAEKVDQSLEALTLAAAQKGFSLATVRPRGTKNYEEKTVDINFYIEEGARIYIERINIFGNDRTREYVIRREFDIDEGDAYNQVLVDRARTRLMRMGIFDNVQINRSQGSAADRVVINVEVVEQSTASLSVGGGYSTGNGFIADISFEERNLMGRGQYLKASIGTGTSTQNYKLSFTEPRFLGRRISAGFDLFRESKDFSDSSSYKTLKTGGSIRTGFKISDQLTSSLNYNYDETEITVTDTNASAAVQAAAGLSKKSSVSYGLTYNSLDSTVNPTNGLFANVKQEIAGLGGNINYVRTIGRATYYQPISGSFIGLVSGKAGHIAGINGDDVRLLDTFKLGGETVRGFESFGLGPRDSSGNQDALGGTSYWAATAEVQFPMPVLPKSIGIKGAFFADAGTLYGTGDLGSLSSANVIGNDQTIRSSVGASLIWSSPFGPLRADFAKVLNKEDGDKEQFFKFGIDTKF